MKPIEKCRRSPYAGTAPPLAAERSATHHPRSARDRPLRRLRPPRRRGVDTQRRAAPGVVAAADTHQRHRRLGAHPRPRRHGRRCRHLGPRGPQPELPAVLRRAAGRPRIRPGRPPHRRRPRRHQLLLLHRPRRPAVTVPACPGILSPVCQAVGDAGGTIVGAGAGAVLGDLATWVGSGASWLLGQVGTALTASTSIDLTAGWFTTHYDVMVGVAAVVALPVLLLSIIQAVYRQSPAVLVRSALVQLPLAFLLTAVAVQLVQLSLAVTDSLCSVVSAGAGGSIQQELTALAAGLLASGTANVPTFVLFIAGILLAIGALVLWFELLARTAAVYVAVLFLPLGLASLVWPAISHWARRLAETLTALVLSKFVIVVVLSLAVSALGSGGQDGLSSVFAGAAL